MSTQVQESKGMDIKLPPPNNYQAICYKLTVIGTVPESYQGGAEALKPKVQLSWELPGQKTVFKEGEEARPFAVHKIFTNSSDKKSNLYKFLNLWSNGKINQDNIKGFDLKNIIGKHCLLNVTHKEASKNKDIKYLEASGIGSLPKEMPKLSQSNPSQIFDVEEFNQEEFAKIPEFIRKMIITSEEFKKLGLNPDQELATATGQTTPEDNGQVTAEDAASQAFDEDQPVTQGQGQADNSNNEYFV